MFYTNCGKVTINGHAYIGMMTRTRPAYYTQYHGIELQLPQRKATKMFLDHGRCLGASFYLVGKSVADEDSQRRDEGFINSEWRCDLMYVRTVIIGIHCLCLDYIDHLRLQQQPIFMYKYFYFNV